jgi:hypothetical protein
MAEQTPKKQGRISGFFVPWYYVSRATGLFILLYGLIFDHTGDRSTLILTGAGLMGLDKVARSEPK